MSSPRPKLRVLVIDSDRWIRDSLAFILGDYTAQICGTAQEALSALDDGLDANVALVDPNLGDSQRAEIVPQLLTKRPSLAPVVFSESDDQVRVLDAIRAGARGYLLKTAGSERIIEGLREALDGGWPMTPSVARMLVHELRAQQFDQQSHDVGLHDLTGRERDVLSLLAKGLTYREASSTMNIGIGTIQTYVKRLYSKLDVTSKAEAATLAQRMGLI